MSLNGLQECLGKGFLMVRHADDFLVLGKTIKDLKKLAIPRIYKFLKPRGLTLSKRKTKITNISKGFDYFGFYFREYSDKTWMKGTKKGIFLIKLAKENIKRFKQKLNEIVKNHRKKTIHILIQNLNMKLRGGGRTLLNSNFPKSIFIYKLSFMEYMLDNDS